MKYGGKNVVAVRVDATKFEGWFYEGAGIYRHVWLDKTAPVAIAPDGIFVYSKFKENLPAEDAEIYVEASVLNKLTNDVTTAVDCEIISPEGKSVAGFNKSMEVPGQSQATVKLESKLSSPDLWSPESPKLYKLVTTVAVGDKIVDRQETAFGIRTVGFDPATGFLLNGKRYELHGTCNHQDHAGVGAAIPDALQEFRVKQLKEFGCNAIRTSHNPPTPELLDVCDRLGMLVMDESRLLGSDSENLRKWDDQIRRDRNHPCVAIWSIANEEFQVQDTPQAADVARTMQNYVKRLDPTRPVTYAAPEGQRVPRHQLRHRSARLELSSTVRKWTTITPNIRSSRTSAPSRPASSARAAFTPTTGRADTSALTTSSGRAGKQRPKAGGAILRIARGSPAGFAWTGFDYRGEPTPCIWPCIKLALRHSRHVWFSEGRLLLLPIVVDDEHGAAPAAALELARQGRPGNSRGGLQQLQTGGTLSERRVARQTGR